VRVSPEVTASDLTCHVHLAAPKPHKTPSRSLPGARVSGTIRLENQSLSLEASVQLEKPGLAAVIHALWELENRNELLVPMLGGLRFVGYCVHCECSHPMKSAKVWAPWQGGSVRTASESL
jgi:hypothetical protein